jgi:hypothetical protein
MQQFRQVCGVVRYYSKNVKDLCTVAKSDEKIKKKTRISFLHHLKKCLKDVVCLTDLGNFILSFAQFAHLQQK